VAKLLSHTDRAREVFGHPVKVKRQISAAGLEFTRGLFFPHATRRSCSYGCVRYVAAGAARLSITNQLIEVVVLWNVLRPRLFPVKSYLLRLSFATSTKLIVSNDV